MLKDSMLMLQVRSNCFISYFKTDWRGQKTEDEKNEDRWKMSIVRKLQYSGQLREGTKKRLTKAIDLLVQVSRERWVDNPITGKSFKHKLSFITLTISQIKNLSAREAYDKCFQHFLQWFRRTAKVNTYIWKCEFQKRGQIHYHITTPSYIPHQEIRDKWNNLQRHAGYIDKYRQEQQRYHAGGFKSRPWLFNYWSLKKQQEAYIKGVTSNWNDPNSTDIHSVKHVMDLSNYLKKEYCKTLQNPDTDGKVWDCSLNLKSVGYYQAVHNHELLIHCNKMIREGKVRQIKNEQCEIMIPNKQGIEQFLTLQQLKDYDDHKQTIRTYKREKPLRKTKLTVIK